MASFAPKPGCPMCSIVSQPYPSLLHSPRSASFGSNSGPAAGVSGSGPAHIIYKDDKVTAYLEKNNPVSSKGHVVIMLNLHVPSIYAFSSSDLPLLMHMQTLGQSLLTRHLRGEPFTSLTSISSSASTNSLNPADAHAPIIGTAVPLGSPDEEKIHVGFIVSPFADPMISVKDHVHCHAYVGTMDRAGWWRKVNYSGMGWYAAEDLIAEIREQTSNNRVKSGYVNRPAPPIARVPDAGARAGYADGTVHPASRAFGNADPALSSPPLTVPALSVSAGDDTIEHGNSLDFSSEPITPRPGDVGAGASQQQQRVSSEDGVKNPPADMSRVRSSGSAMGGATKKPLGPRTRDSMNTNSMQMSPVGSPKKTPEPVPAM